MKRLLIAGFGDVARRAAAMLPPGTDLRPLSRALGADLDRPETLAGIGAWADVVLHSAPPPDAGTSDPRTAKLLAALAKGGILPSRIVYISTSGVYGDCGGAWVDETRSVNPHTDRAARRADAERQLLAWGERHAVAIVILRAPGIYAAERLPLERLRSGTPVLIDAEDVYTNHIHADDLAAIAVAALAPGAPAGVYNASDDSEMKMGAYFDLVAERFGLPRPARVPRSEAAQCISAPLLSFMSESRRMLNRKMKAQLGVKLRYPTVREGVPYPHDRAAPGTRP